jgi:hypothetical protein
MREWVFLIFFRVEVLLQKSFRYIAIEELRLIPVALLMRFDKIPNLYLEQLAGNLELVTQLPIAIKRQVWEFSPPVFKAHIKVLFDEYVNDAEKWKVYAEVFTRATDLVDILGTISSAYGSETKAKAKNRRDVDHVLKKLLEFIGSSKILYYSAVELIRDLFGQTSNVLYALLRMEILMSFHDEGNREVCNRSFFFYYSDRLLDYRKRCLLQVCMVLRCLYSCQCNRSATYRRIALIVLED